MVFGSVEEESSKPHLVSERGLFYRFDGPAGPYPDMPRTYFRSVTSEARWFFLPSDNHPCTNGLSGYPYPPNTPWGDSFLRCVEGLTGR